MLAGNKGEWSEIYTLLKVLSDGKLYSGDGDLNKITDLFFPVISVLRKESNGSFNFSYEDELIFIKKNYEQFRIPIREFKRLTKILFREIKNGKGSFEIPQVNDFLEKYGSTTLKAKSTSKTDIEIRIHDLRTGLKPMLGFSIKSQLGTPSTLLNPGKTTNFIFKIGDKKLPQNIVDKINNIKTKSHVKDRLDYLHSNGYRLSFYEMERTSFKNNLVLIDSSLPRILAEVVLCFYLGMGNKISVLESHLRQYNPCNYDTNSNQPFYEYKLKRLLSDIALGMTPGKPWDGILDATGGYLIVKEDGEILCYHIYNRNQFEDYIYLNTRLDTASTNRYDFGYVYSESGMSFIKLNLQIRFIK